MQGVDEDDELNLRPLASRHDPVDHQQCRKEGEDLSCSRSHLKGSIVGSTLSVVID